MTDNIGPVLLGAVIANADSGEILPEGIHKSLFESARDKTIFEAVTDITRENKPPNLALLKDHLTRIGKLKDAGGVSYLTELTSLPGTYASLIPHYADTLIKQAREKEIHRAILEAAEMVKTAPALLDVNGLINKLAVKDTERASFRLTRIGKIDIKPPEWAVRHFLEKDSFCSIYGDSGAGKSFLAIELAACVATGTPFYCLPVKQGPVFYIAGEGNAGIARRLLAWSRMRGVSLERAQLYLSTGAVSLIEPLAMGAVNVAIEKLILKIGNPALVIMDTWSRVLGGDDSSPQDAAAGVSVMDGLRARHGNFAAVVIHHCGNSEKNRSRGWSGLRAAVDMEYRAERGADGILRLECTKAKDSAPIESMAFQFTEVELPIRTDSGEFMTSAVLNRVEWEPAPKAGKETSGLGKNQVTALEALRGLSGVGETVTLDAWREACQKAGIDRRRFPEVKQSLQKSGDITINNLLVSEARRPTDPLLYSGVGSDGRTGNVRNTPILDVSDVSDTSDEEIEF